MNFTIEELIQLAEAGANVTITITAGATVQQPPPADNPPPAEEPADDKYADYRRLQMPDPKNRLVVYGIADNGLADGDKVESYIYHGDDVEVLDFYPADDDWYRVRIAAVGWHGQRGNPKTEAGAIGWLKLGDGVLTNEPWR